MRLFINYEKGFLVKHRLTALLDESSAVFLFIAVAGQRCCRSVVIGWKIRLGDRLEDTDIFQISTSLFEFRLPLIISELERQKYKTGRYGRFFTQLILFKLNLEHTEES